MRSTERPLGGACALAVALALLLLAGCVSMPAPAYQAGIGNTERLMRLSMGPVALGPFDAAPGADRPLNVRGSHLQGGSDGSFAAYVREAFATELSTAGRLDANARTRITGTLLHNDLHASTAGGGARIRMRFRVERDGETAYDREIDAEHGWESSFIGAIAIPAAMDSYAGTVQKLIGQLLDDPAFQEAVSAER